MISDQLDIDVAFGNHAHEFAQFCRRDGAGAFFFNLRFAGSADAELDMGGGNVEAAAFRIDKKIGEDGNGGLTLDHTLRGAKFIQQRGFCDAEFHCLIILADDYRCCHCDLATAGRSTAISTAAVLYSFLREVKSPNEDPALWKCRGDEEFSIGYVASCASAHAAKDFHQQQKSSLQLFHMLLIFKANF